MRQRESSGGPSRPLRVAADRSVTVKNCCAQGLKPETSNLGFTSRRAAGDRRLQARRAALEPQPVCQGGTHYCAVLRDDGMLPLICPTCQNVCAGKASMPATPCYFAWGWFRYFSWEREPRRILRPGAENLATPRQPVRHEVATHVLGTGCYLCVRAGHNSGLAEGVGFEPTVPLQARRFSSCLLYTSDAADE